MRVSGVRNAAVVSGDGQRGGGVPVPGKGLPRAGGGMVHWRPAVQAFLKPGCVLPNVVQQPGKAAICFRAKGCGKSGGQICRSLQMLGNRLLPPIVRDVCKVCHAFPPVNITVE